MYVRAGRPAFARPYVGVHRITSLMSSSLLIQQCPACLTWRVFVMGGRWPYIYIYIGLWVWVSVWVHSWVAKKKGFYLQHLWTVSYCLEKFLCGNSLCVVFSPKMDKKSCAHVNPHEPAWGSETGNRGEKEQGRWSVKFKTWSRRVGSLRVRQLKRETQRRRISSSQNGLVDREWGHSSKRSNVWPV